METKNAQATSLRLEISLVETTHAVASITDIMPNTIGINLFEIGLFLSPMPIKYSTGTKISSSGFIKFSIFIVLLTQEIFQ